MTPDFSPEIWALVSKKPLEQGDIPKLKRALRDYAENYLDLKKGGNSQINLTDTFTNDIEVADANDNFIRDIGRQMERTRDFVMHENERKDGRKEYVVVPLDRPLTEKYSTHFAIGGIILGAILGVFGGVLGNYLQHRWQPQHDTLKKIEVKALSSPDSVLKTYQIEIKDLTNNKEH